MNLEDILRRYLISVKEAGLLSIKFDGMEHLFKIYIDEKGNVVYMTFGTCKNEECLEKIKNLKPSEYFFLKGVKPPSVSPLPLSEKLLSFTGFDTSAVTREGASGEKDISPEILMNIENDFVNIIGPIGKVIIDNLYNTLSYKRGDSMKHDDFTTFIESLINELPPSEQSKFSSRYKKL